MIPDEATCRWLVGDEGRAWVERAAELTGSSVQRAARLRRDLTAECAAAVLAQCELRARAQAKFLAAERLFFLPIPLEQATDQLVAEYKARRFARFSTTADLCCGIGGDLMALAILGDVTGIDRNQSAVLFAQANLNVLGRQGRVSAREFAPDSIETDAWHIDPDRRPAGRRSTHVEYHEPGRELIDALRTRRSSGAIKLAPATEIPDGWADDGEREWISRGGECKQQVVWFGDLAESPGQVRATVLARPLNTPLEQCLLARVSGERGASVPCATTIGRYVCEPDAAVLAADLTGHLATQYALQCVTPGIAYLTADLPTADAALACFEVLEVMPYRPARVAAWLRERHIGRLEIKLRGVAADPAAVRKQLRVAGDASAAIILLPIGRNVKAIIARRLAVND